MFKNFALDTAKTNGFDPPTSFLKNLGSRPPTKIRGLPSAKVQAAWRIRDTRNVDKFYTGYGKNQWFRPADAFSEKLAPTAANKKATRTAQRQSPGRTADKGHVQSWKIFHWILKNQWFRPGDVFSEKLGPTAANKKCADCPAPKSRPHGG